MSRRLLYCLAAAVLTVGVIVFSGCAALLGDFEVTAAQSEAGADGGGKAEGEACQGGADCTSAFCADGVCCESACSGTCEQCNLQGMAGKCMPVPDGQDPQSECPTTPLPDAGPDDAGIVFDDGGDAGDMDAGGDAGNPDAGPTFQLPEAGVTTEQNQCAGTCNGKRACNYPGKERTCGSVVCGNTAQQGRASCDGSGHCLLGVEQCEAYACPDGSPGCKKTCTGESDCLPTHFCDALSSSCKPKLQDGSTCQSVAQCGSGFCVQNVCCNSGCEIVGGTCTQPGSVGKCRCSECATGPCKLYYRDEDLDTFGDKFGTVMNLRAKAGCVSGPAPAGFVDNALDCYDGPGIVPPRVRPNQTGWFPDQYVSPPNGVLSDDYNCDGLITKETPEYLNGTCRFCRPPGGFIISCTSTTTSCTNNEAAGLACSSNFCFPKPCAGCQTITTTGFTSTVDCGDTRTATNCGYCSNNAIVGNSFPQVQQRCH